MKLSFYLVQVCLATFCIFLTSCEFFGKKSNNETLRAPGDLGNGTFILGTYSFSTASAISTRNPTNSLTTTYTFEPNGNAKIQLLDPHLGGLSCTGYGQYRVVGTSDVFIHLQAVSASYCLLPSVTHLSALKVKAQSIEFINPPDPSVIVMFADRVQSKAPVGLWDFRGVGGIDFIFFDPHGYFLMQINENKQLYLLLGSYQLVNGVMKLIFFSNLDPTSTAGTLIFDRMATDGSILELSQVVNSQTVTYSGYRL